MIARQLKGPPLNIPIYAKSEANNHINGCIINLQTGEEANFDNEEDFLAWINLAKIGDVKVKRTQLGGSNGI